MSEEIRNELKKELKNIAALYSLELEEKKEARKASSKRTLQDELNNISILYNL